MKYHYPTPQEVGIVIPGDLLEDRFNKGFLFALKGGQLRHGEHFRRSFRLGYRSAKLYLRDLRKQQGIIEFPTKWKVKFKASA